MKRSFQIAILALATLGAFALVPQARADTIISDAFSGTDGDPLNGRTPDAADLPGTTYTTASYATFFGQQPVISSSSGNPAPSAITGFNAATFIDISSTGTYTKPSEFTLSLSVKINSIEEDNAAGSVRGIGLGFFSPAPTNNTFMDASAKFTGLTVAPDGSLHLVLNGVQSMASAPAFGGFSNSAFYPLSYTVDTVTGSITSVFFNGNDETAAFSGASAGFFTDAVTNLAGFYGSTATDASFYGFVDNFNISEAAVPEPSTWIAMTGVLGVIGCRHRYRRGCMAQPTPHL